MGDFYSDRYQSPCCGSVQVKVTPGGLKCRCGVEWAAQKLGSGWKFTRVEDAAPKPGGAALKSGGAVNAAVDALAAQLNRPGALVKAYDVSDVAERQVKALEAIVERMTVVAGMLFLILVVLICMALPK